MTNEAPRRENILPAPSAKCSECKRLESLVLKAEHALRDIEQQLRQAQKMETLGTLVAGVAHEINNPINLILYNLPLVRKTWADFMLVLMDLRRLQPDRKFGGFTYDFLKDHLPHLIADMEMAANRVVKIVADLKNFSRQSNMAEKAPLNINTAVHNALRLSQSTLRKAGVHVVLELEESLPHIEGDLQNIEQIVDYAFETAGIASLVTQGVEAIRNGGTCVAVGAAPLPQTLDLGLGSLFAVSGKKVMGTLLGRCHALYELPRLVALWQAGRLDLESLITARRPLAEINQAMDDLRASRGIRSVLEI